MNHPPDDGHVAHLQRLAYGADSTPEERRQAVDELRTLATETDVPGLSRSPEAAGPPGSADRAGGRGGTPAPGGSGTAAAGAAPATTTAEAPAPDGEPGAGQRLAIRIGVVAGAAALAVGVLAGWQLARLDGDAGREGVPPPTRRRRRARAPRPDRRHRDDARWRPARVPPARHPR